MRPPTRFPELLVLVTFVLLSAAYRHDAAGEPESSRHSGELSSDSVRYFSSFDGTQIAFQDAGAGPPVILLHGMAGTSEFWSETALFDSLAASGYRIIRPDLRGNGASDHPRDPEAWEDDAEVRDLVELADFLELEHFSAVGYSRGSIVLAKLLTMDSRIDRAVLGGMGINFTDPEWDRRLQFADVFSGRTPPHSLTRGGVEYARAAGADFVSLGLQQDYQPVTSIAELGRLDLPVLVLAGDQDEDNGSPSALAGAIPDAVLRRVPGDHLSTYGSESFADAVLEFLEDAN